MKIRKIVIIAVTLGVQSKDLQLITAMFSEDKVTEIIYLADEFCNFFDAQQEKSMLEVPQDGKRDRHKPNRMGDAEIIVNSYISTRANSKIVCTRFEKY